MKQVLDLVHTGEYLNPFDEIIERLDLEKTPFKLREQIVFLYANRFYVIKGRNDFAYIKRIDKINGDHLKCSFEMLLTTEIELLNRLFNTLK